MLFHLEVATSVVVLSLFGGVATGDRPALTLGLLETSFNMLVANGRQKLWIRVVKLWWITMGRGAHKVENHCSREEH